MSTDPPRDEANDLPQNSTDPAEDSPAQEGEQVAADAVRGPGPLPASPGTTEADAPAEPSKFDETSRSGSAYTATYGEAPAGSDAGARDTGATPATDEAVPAADPFAADPVTEPENDDRTDRLETTGDTGLDATAPAPSREEDEALRDERARRFGRFGRSRTEDDDLGEPTTGETRTTALPASGAGASGGTTATTALPAENDVEPVPVRESTREPQINEDNPFEDWDDPPRSRTSAHWWGVLISLVFVPVAWYLLADGGERWANSREVNPDAIHFGAMLEIAGGLLALIAVLLAARWSSVGAIITGSIATVIGAAFLAVPQIVVDFLADYSDIFGRLGQFGQNVYDHLLMDGNAGRVLAYGVVLIFAGVISHGARRQGRREERRRAAAEI